MGRNYTSRRLLLCIKRSSIWCQINLKSVITIQIRFDLTKFRNRFVCVQTQSYRFPFSFFLSYVFFLSNSVQCDRTDNFPLFFNWIEFFFALEQEENCQYDHITLDLWINRNLFCWDYSLGHFWLNKKELWTKVTAILVNDTFPA